MSRDALKDAFIAGHHACENHAPNDIPSDTDIIRKFDHWYSNAIDTGVRDSTDANPDGWIEWDGSADMPPGLSGSDHVEVLFRDRETQDADQAFRYYWLQDGSAVDIVAYRVVRS